MDHKIAKSNVIPNVQESWMACWMSLEPWQTAAISMAFGVRR